MTDLTTYRRAECHNLKDCEYGPHVIGMGNGEIQDWHMEPDSRLQDIAYAWKAWLVYIHSTEAVPEPPLNPNVFVLLDALTQEDN